MNHLNSDVPIWAGEKAAGLTTAMGAPCSSNSSKPRRDFEDVIQTGVLDPNVLSRHLGSISLDDSNEEVVCEAQVRRVLKFHEGKRCTFEIGLRTERGWHSIIAKIYRKDRSDVFEAMKGIRDSGFGRRDEFSISQPAAFIVPLRCLLQEKVEGTPANEIFKTGGELARAIAAERCALWLARFHAVAPKAGPVSHPREFIHSKPMMRWSAKINSLEGCLRDHAAELFQRLNLASASLSDVDLKAGHGSYNAAHVYLSKDRTVTIDWDWHDVADPARDVARFLYALRRWALDELGSIEALDKAAETFLSTYRAVGPPLSEKNLRFFGATTCLNLALRHLFEEESRFQEKQEKAEVMLAKGLSVLEGRNI